MVQAFTSYAGNLFPRLLFGRPKSLLQILGALSTLPVKKYGMGLQNHVTSAKEKCTSLISAIGYLIGIVTGKQVFPTADHIRVVKGERRDKEIMGYHK